MKKLLLALLFVVSTFFVSGDEILIYQGEGYHYNDILQSMVDAQFAIKYNTEKDVYYFFSSDIFNKGWVQLTELQLESFKNTLNKYVDWENTAVEKGVEIKKEFPESAISTKVTWKFGDDWYGASINMNFKFFSQSKTRHQFLIKSNNVSASSNEFIDYKIETFYLDKKQVNNLINGISKTSIEKIITEHKKNKEVENLFK